MTRTAGIAFGAMLLASCSGPTSAQSNGSPGGITLSASVTATASCTHGGPTDELLAETRSGDVVQIGAGASSSHLVAQGVLPDGGMALRSGDGQLYVAASGPGGMSSIWEIPNVMCGTPARLVVAQAELPSVSPDGSYLGYVTLDGSGRQTGVSIVNLQNDGRPASSVRHLATATVPPPLPIRGIAIGVDDGTLAVWGGFVDSYLTRRHPTVGTLVPTDARSLSSLAPVFDAKGISSPALVGPSQGMPEAWQAAPAYLPNGEFLVWDNGDEIVMPFTDTSPGEDAGGIRNIEQVPGVATSISAGPDGSLAWIGPDGHLEISSDAINLPFGPAASTVPPLSPPVTRRVNGTFSNVVWGDPPSVQSTRPPPVFSMVDHLPNVVGLTQSKAEQVMGALALPVFIAHTTIDPNVPLGTVLTQDPGAGTGVACQCAIALTVSTDH